MFGLDGHDLVWIDREAVGVHPGTCTSEHHLGGASVLPLEISPRCVVLQRDDVVRFRQMILDPVLATVRRVPRGIRSRGGLADRPTDRRVSGTARRMRPAYADNAEPTACTSVPIAAESDDTGAVAANSSPTSGA